ncbi:hypothetical protein FHETE_3201 [Fusarium heterosporum]|uniref:Uncharacterized protein n=1 Tax=Fusarium heterosporum TaxID=42747 RepID=A0A8H5TRF1_FUSHE|nr:hypothetical protein FHETE_3201 [Fusarium heterosporum]
MSRSPSSLRDAQPSFLSNDEDSTQIGNMEEEMKLEKERYPGASSWAPAEERLFEILFKRQDLPMLPTTWDVDLRGVPISDVVFKTSEEFPPIIYAHSKNFRATMALTRLMDLTARARTNIQSGIRRTVSQLIRRELQKYLNWAAQDGDYQHLRIVRNIIVEVVDTTMPEDEITEYIQKRMRSLATMQREFLREDANPHFWDVLKPSIFRTPKIKIEPEDELSLLEIWPTPTGSRDGSHTLTKKHPSTTESHDVVVEIEPGLKETSISATQKHKTMAISEKQSLPDSPSSLSSLGEPQTPSDHTYRRHPPVVYGLFILNTSVLVLTTDSSKGADAYVSFHVQVDFQDEHQGIWNALTVAIVVCLARDELRTRLSDFEELPCLEESDPDA